MQRAAERFSILDLAAGDVDHQLGELRWIAGTFESVLWHGSINDHVDAVCEHDRNEGKGQKETVV